jgi:DNA-binding response OmpR family regulator
MSSRDTDAPTTPKTSRYVAVDPQTLGRLRTLKIGDVELRVDGHQLIVRGTSVPLPRKEFVILQQLMDNAGRVVTRRELLDNAWGPDRAQVRNYLECTYVGFV